MASPTRRRAELARQLRDLSKTALASGCSHGESATGDACAVKRRVAVTGNPVGLATATAIPWFCRSAAGLARLSVWSPAATVIIMASRPAPAGDCPGWLRGWPACGDSAARSGEARGPVQVTGLTGATQVAAGSYSGYAVHVPLPAVPDLTDDTTTEAGQALQAAGLVLGTRPASGRAATPMGTCGPRST